MYDSQTLGIIWQKCFLQVKNMWLIMENIIVPAIMNNNKCFQTKPILKKTNQQTNKQSTLSQLIQPALNFINESSNQLAI